MDPVRTPYEEFSGEQLAVDLPHLNLVVGQLEEFKVALAAPPEKAPELSLALLTLDEDILESKKQELCQDAEFAQAVTAAQPDVYLAARRTWADMAAIEVLTFALRREFAGRFGGWSPALGKNRVADGIEGRPGVSGGGGGEPVAINQSLVQQPSPRPGAGRDIRVGVLDTRLFPHPALDGKHLTPDEDLLPRALSGSIHQAAGHATFIAGLILDRAPEVELRIRHALDETEAKAPLWKTARRMMEFRDVHILNLSWIYMTADHEPSLIMARAVDQLDSDVVLVAAAGNHGVVHPQLGAPALPPNRPVQPGALPGVVAVGALDGGLPAAFSPKPAPWISLGAPGVDLVSTFLKGPVLVNERNGADVVIGATEVSFNDGYARWSGTSFAAANVTGEIAARMTAKRCTAKEAVEDLIQGVFGSDVRPSRP